MDPIILDALRLALQRRRYDFGGQVEWSAPKEPEPVKQPDEEEQEKFLKEQLAGSAPQYEPEAGLKTAKEAGLMAAGFAPGSGIASAAGAFPTAEGGFEPSLREDISAGRYGSAALKGVGAAGDIVSAVPVVGTALGTAMKAPLALKLATAMAPAAKIAREAATTEAGPVKAALQTAYERSVTPMGLYSHAAETAANLPQAKGSYEQMMAMLQKAGVKPEELHWSGAQQFAGQPVTREQLVQHFEQGVPKIEETVLGQPKSSYPFTTADEWQSAINRAERRGDWNEVDSLTNAWERFEGSGSAKFSKYALPGGENYREVLMHMPTIKPIDINSTELRAKAAEMYGEKYVDRLSPEQWDIVGRNFQQEEPYRSSHWDQPNVLAHLRLSDRTGSEGEKILHMEELQSDWGQAGRKQGFREAKEKELADAVAERDAIEAQLKDQKPDVATIDRLNALHDRIADIGRGDVGVPSAPYVASPEGKHTSSWVDLGLKRALKEAAEGGYDKLVWTPGAEQASRYDLSKHIDELHWNRGNLVAYDKDGNKVIQRTGMLASELPDVVGKDVADKLLAQEAGSDGWRSLEGQDLSVGGEGMKSFYDKIVPTQLSKIVKKLDPSAKIELDAHPIATEGSEVRAHVIPITPKMREAILKGLPAYKRGGAVDANVNARYNEQKRRFIKDAIKITRRYTD